MNRPLRFAGAGKPKQSTMKPITDKQGIVAALQANVGTTVQIENRAHADMSYGGMIDFQLAGTLEAPEDDLDRWYVRVKEDAMGTSGIGFPRHLVTEVETLTYGQLRITIR